MRMAEPGEVLYTEWHRYPRSRRTGGKEKTNLEKRVKELEKIVMKLNEFKEKREESMFYFKAQMERAEPKTASEAEDLQRAKELFEKLYREELSGLKEEMDMAITHNLLLIEENKKLKENVETLELWLDNKEKVNKSLREENEKLKSDLETVAGAYFDR